MKTKTYVCRGDAKDALRVTPIGVGRAVIKVGTFEGEDLNGLDIYLRRNSVLRLGLALLVIYRGEEFTEKEFHCSVTPSDTLILSFSLDHAVFYCRQKSVWLSKTQCLKLAIRLLKIHERSL